MLPAAVSAMLGLPAHCSPPLTNPLHQPAFFPFWHFVIHYLSITSWWLREKLNLIFDLICKHRQNLKDRDCPFALLKTPTGQGALIILRFPAMDVVSPIIKAELFSNQTFNVLHWRLKFSLVMTESISHTRLWRVWLNSAYDVRCHDFLE